MEIDHFVSLAMTWITITIICFFGVYFCNRIRDWWENRK